MKVTIDKTYNFYFNRKELELKIANSSLNFELENFYSTWERTEEDGIFLDWLMGFKEESKYEIFHTITGLNFFDKITIGCAFFEYITIKITQLDVVEKTG
jgi:hypothetical protein